MPQGLPKYRVIIDYLRDGIEAGRFAHDRRLPSEAELARKFRTSRPTVVRAMQELRQAGLIDRRIGSGTFLRPSDATSAVATLGLIISGLGATEVWEPICAHITRAAEARHHVVLRGLPTDDRTDDDFSPQHAEALARQYIDRRVQGVFFAPLELPEDRAAINRRIASLLDAAGIAVVLLDRDVPDFPARSRFDLVGIDNFAAGFDLANSVLDTGRRRLAFVARPHYPSTTDLRLAGCREALACRGLSAAGPWPHVGNPADPDFVRTILTPPAPEAIICANDLTAAQLMQTLAQLRRRVPADVAVAGFDDVRYATLLSVPLTTMRQPCRDLGDVAVQTMLERIASPSLPPRQVLLPAKLMARQSTAAAA